MDSTATTPLTTGASVDPTGGADGSGSDTADTGDLPPPPSECVDLDGDGYGSDCDAGPDCDDDNAGAWTEAGCASCVDADGDGWWVGCDAFPDGVNGPDCDDTDGCNWTEAGCANCVDSDGDDFWTNCDIYGDCAPGPDCDDNNDTVQGDDSTELCNGVAENCAGFIDPYDPDAMCPPMGVTAPNVGEWACIPPAPGVDGCTIAECEPEQHDLDADYTTGCECLGQPPSNQGLTCGMAIDIGDIPDDGEVALVTGNVLPVDRDVWYRFRAVDGADNGCDNYHVRVRFLSNPGGQFAFQVARGGCDQVPAPGTDCTTDWSWATDFRATINNVLAGECPCTLANPPATDLSPCQDNTADYFVRVIRDPAYVGDMSCAGYQIEISNGLYDTM